MSRYIKCLPYKHEDLSSDLQHPNKKLGMVAHSYNPGARGMKMWGNPWGLLASHPS